MAAPHPKAVIVARTPAPPLVERLAARDGLTSSAAVGRTHRLDGRTAVVAVRDAQGWRRIRGTRWTTGTAAELRAQRVLEVVIRRGLRSGRLPLAWVPRAEGV